MIGSERVFALIPARGGSKGIPRKNLRPLLGKPLIQWTIEAALGSRYVDRTIVSTEDAEIADVARAAGADVPFTRPPELATDSAHAVQVVEHALDALAGIDEPFDYLVYLEPTSPLRASSDIDGALDVLARHRGDYAASVTATIERPEWMFFLTDDGRLDPVIGRFDARPRQQLPPCYVFNGAVYAVRVDAFRRDLSLSNERTFAHVMPPERSMDIDTFDDFNRAAAILQGGAPVSG